MDEVVRGDPHAISATVAEEHKTQRCGVQQFCFLFAAMYIFAALTSRRIVSYKGRLEQETTEHT